MIKNKERLSGKAVQRSERCKVGAKIIRYRNSRVLASNGIISRIIGGVINEIITRARYNAVARTSLWVHYDIAWTMGDDLADLP